MRGALLLMLGASLAVIVMAAGGIVYVRTTGLATRASAGAVETVLARTARRLSVPASVRERSNPVPATAAAIADGMAHYADHCAACHANDGSGDTEMGRGLHPPAPEVEAVPGWARSAQEGAAPGR